MELEKIRKQGEVMLVTLDNWFWAKDGQQYRAVWGRCRIVEAKDIFGFKPSHGTNWYLVAGAGDNTMVIAGCQIHFAQLCLEQPVGTHVYCV